MKSAIEKKPGCIQTTLDILGDKWTALILRDVTDQPKTFSELEISLTGISPRTLSQRLKQLETDDVLERCKYCAHPPRYRYQLTKKGRELRKILESMAEWGGKYC